MKNSKGKTLYEIVSLDSHDLACPMAANLSQATARKMLQVYRNIKHVGEQYRYVMRRQR